MKKIVAIVVTFNRKELLKECIENLLSSEISDRNLFKLDILIVDNNSIDGTREYISEIIKDNSNVIYENTGANLGGAGGFNYGMKRAVELGYDFAWVMDDDCIVHKDTLQKLLDYDKKLDGKYGFLSSKVLWKDNSICTMNIQKRKFSKWLKDFDTSCQEIAMASFVSLFLKTEIIKELGLPIKDFFIWTDDWEFTRRISRKYKCYFISESVVTHKSKENFGASIAVVDDRLERFRYLYRNDVVLYRREGIKGWILLYIRLLIHKFRILKSNKNNKNERINLINKAIKEGKSFFPKIEYVFAKPVKVLQIFGEPLSNGGQESCIMNFYRFIDKEKVQFDFYTPFYCDNENMKNEIEKLGGKVFSSNGKFKKYNFVKNTKKFLKENNYDIVHINSGSIFKLAKGAQIAYKAGVKKIIVHSHAGGYKENIKHKIIYKFYGKYFIKYPTTLLACSKTAGEWKYPKEVIEKEKYIIINNGVDLDKFKFNSEIRNRVRKELNIPDDTLVIGHVGRFFDQKNHEFLIEIFKEIYSKKSNSMLLLVGDGELRSKIENMVNELKLSSNVKFLGIQKNVNEIYQAMDIFILPSLYEGLPVVAIEAQASGLKCLLSDNITKECKILNSTKFISLEKDSKQWAKMALKMSSNNDRKDVSSIVKDKGFDIRDEVRNLENIYLKN